MGPELRSDKIKPLANAIGDTFDMPELDGIVLRSTGARLFKEWVPQNDTHRVTAYKLLLRLEDDGRVRLFLANVLASARTNTALRELIAEACPAALKTEVEVKEQIPAVVAGLEAARAKLPDPAVKEALAASRDSLEIVVQNIDILESYKNLHDCLHLLQMKPLASLRSIAKGLAKDPSHAGELRDYLEQLKMSCAKARDWTDRLPDSRTVRGLEIFWIDALEAAADKYDSALEAEPSNFGAIIAALNEVRQVIRTEPFRLNRQIYITAKELPLENLTDALRKISEALGTRYPELITAYGRMRDLRATLLGRVVLHKMWQDADNKVWTLEETFEYGADEAREDFIFAWPDAKESILALAAREPKAKWSQKMQERTVSLDDELAREAPSKELVGAFDAYRRDARFHFFRVDADLRSDCAALARIGAPLRRILGDLQ
jgi:hypothetical protein